MKTKSVHNRIDGDIDVGRGRVDATQARANEKFHPRRAYSEATVNCLDCMSSVNKEIRQFDIVIDSNRRDCHLSSTRGHKF